VSVAKYRAGETVYYVEHLKIRKSLIVGVTLYPSDEYALYDINLSEDGRQKEEVCEEYLFATELEAATYLKNNLVEKLKYFDSMKEITLSEIAKLEKEFKGE
jgi:Zn-finger protein